MRISYDFANFLGIYYSHLFLAWNLGIDRDWVISFKTINNNNNNNDDDEYEQQK